MIEVGDLLRAKPSAQFSTDVSYVSTIPKDELFLVIPTPQGHNCHADYVWVERIMSDYPPHQVCLEYFEKVQ